MSRFWNGKTGCAFGLPSQLRASFQRCDELRIGCPNGDTGRASLRNGTYRRCGKHRSFFRRLTSGIAWIASLDGGLGTGGSLSANGLSLGDHVLTAAVVDALGRTGSAAVAVRVRANAPPTIVVTNPPHALAIGEHDAVALVAEVFDLEEGDLTLEVVWTSNRDGLLGQGSPLGVSALSVGEHEITTSVSDSRGATASAKVVVAVPEPTIGLGLALGAAGMAIARRARRRSVAESLSPAHRPECDDTRT